MNKKLKPAFDEYGPYGNFFPIEPQPKLDGFRGFNYSLDNIGKCLVPEVCPECKGKGVVTLFTSVQPCSLCGNKE